MNPTNRHGERRQLTTRVTVEPVPDEFTGIIVTVSRIGLARGKRIEFSSSSVQSLSCLVPYSFRIDCSCPNTREKNGKRIKVDAKGPVSIVTCDCKHRARASHWVQNSERPFALAQGFERNAGSHARRKR